MEDKEAQAATGERMRRAMEEKGLSAYDVAEAIGVRAPTVYRWLTGQSRPSAATMLRFAAIVGKKRVWLEFGQEALDYVAATLERWADHIVEGRDPAEGLRAALAADDHLDPELVQRIGPTGGELIGALEEISGAPWASLTPDQKQAALQKLVRALDLLADPDR